MMMMVLHIDQESLIGGLAMMLGWDWNEISWEEVVSMCMRYEKAFETRREAGVMAQAT